MQCNTDLENTQYGYRLKVFFLFESKLIFWNVLLCIRIFSPVCN